MALERKDVRLKLDHDMHAALAVLCEVEGCDLNDFAERELVRVIKERLHAATVIAEHAQRLGIAGIGREKPGAQR